MHPIVTKLQQDYPSPVPAHTANPEGHRIDVYCVGGSLCLSYPEAVEGLTPRRFPNPVDLADWLLALNPQLNQDAAYDFASRITHNNDASCFLRAYQVLDQALTYTQSEE